MNDRYVSPLSERYASDYMQSVFSPNTKYRTWRKLWVALAQSQKELGLAITDEQIDELKLNMNNINYDVVKKREKEIRHDVMAHIFAYGEQCPKAKKIIHLGATSCFVGDNTDIIQMKKGLESIKMQLQQTISTLANFAKKYKDIPTLGFTHFQPAQPTTVGKRATLWIMDLLLDLEQLDFLISTLKLRGCKGTTGTQASFMELFEGDGNKAKQLDQKVAEKMGFSGTYPVTGQTYSRKIDAQILGVLSGIAQTAYKFSNDIRLLAHLKEIEEPFEKEQVGSSAMAYKRNPMRTERMASLCRFVIVDAMNPALTATGQWLERTLDDSANKRLSIPEAFLATDAILSLYNNVASGLVVYPKVIEKHLRQELPFMITENIIMHCVKKGGDRQDLHEAIRVHSVATAHEIKVDGLENNLIDKIASDKIFNLTKNEIIEMMDPNKFIGRAIDQVDEFLEHDVAKALADYEENSNYMGSITL